MGHFRGDAAPPLDTDAIRPIFNPMPPSAFAAPPDLADIHAMAQTALATIPAALRGRVDGVVIRVEDFCDEETEAEMGLESPFELLGLYRGVPFGERGVGDTPHDVDMIFLYRRPLLDYWCETGEDLYHLVRNTLIHEIGHHFGFSDADMERLEAEG
jgi:predicted Zn-dependent protease with MMP-like domain